MKRAILLIFAHPDDESFGTAGTVARYTRCGVPIDLVCATRGERGMRLGVPDNVDTGTAREAELRAAAAITGIRNIHFLGYGDSELDKADTGEITAKVLSVMRKLQPEVVITFGPDGITGHPDHIAIGRAASRAFEIVHREGGSRKLYYVTLPETDISEEGETTRSDDRVIVTIDISEYLDVKIQAVAAHKSQPDAIEFVEMLKQSKDSGLPTREFFHLVNPRDIPQEDTLF
ncbi:MAG: PIG-L family deacetylase [Chloroflexi bacterium]|nr:PIG-L family deacetylase [Chloroflexota bacterium]